MSNFTRIHPGILQVIILSTIFSYVTVILAVLQAVERRDYRRIYEMISVVFWAAGILQLGGLLLGWRYLPLVLVGTVLPIPYWLSVWRRFLRVYMPASGLAVMVCFGILSLPVIDGFGTWLAFRLEPPVHYRPVVAISILYTFLYAPLLVVLIIRAYPGLHSFTRIRKISSDPQDGRE